MNNCFEPKIGHFYEYDHSDYTNTSLFFKKERGFYYFIETDDGSDPSMLWVNKVTLEEFNKRFKETNLDLNDKLDKYTLECFFDGLKTLLEKHEYYYKPEYIELTSEDYKSIKYAVSMSEKLKELRFQTRNIFDLIGDELQEADQEKNEKKQILSLSEVCEEYGLKRSWIYYLIRKKRIPHYKPNGGRKLFFKRDEVENFLLTNKYDQK